MQGREEKRTSVLQNYNIKKKDIISSSSRDELCIYRLVCLETRKPFGEGKKSFENQSYCSEDLFKYHGKVNSLATTHIFLCYKNSMDVVDRYRSIFAMITIA